MSRDEGGGAERILWPTVPAGGMRKKNSPVSCCRTGTQCKTHGPNFTALDGEVRADVGAGTNMQSADINTSVIVTFT